MPCKGCGGPKKEHRSYHYCAACRAKRAEPTPRKCIGCGTTENLEPRRYRCTTCLGERERDRLNGRAAKARRGRRDVLLPHQPRSVYASLTMEQRAEVKRRMEQDHADRRAFESSIH